jgi:hypothetical protein
MNVQRGHLRLVEPWVEPPMPEDGGPEVFEEGEREREKPVDTVRRLILFRCMECGKQSSTDRPVLERWCVGNTSTGQPTHGPVKMTRTEVE